MWVNRVWAGDGDGGGDLFFLSCPRDRSTWRKHRYFSSQLKAETKKKHKREEITKLIASDSTNVTLVSPVIHERSSKCWSLFKLLSVASVLQDFAICNTCKTLITYKTSTGTGGLQKHADSCTKRIVEKDSQLSTNFLSRKHLSLR